MSKADRPEPAAFGSLPHDEPVESLLRSHKPPAPEPSEAFRSSLREHFVSAAVQQAVAAEAREKETIERQPAGGAQSRWLALRWPVAALGLALAALLTVGLGRWMAPEAPPATIAGQELVAANAEAWVGVRDIKGWYTDAEGRRYEEWVRFEGSRPPYYRRLLDGPAIVSGVTQQWNISDGQQAWLVDGVDGRIVEAVDLTGGEMELLSTPTDLQCAFLELPAEIELGAETVASVALDGHPSYRLEATVSGQPRVYWLDAADHLVRRIEAEDGTLLWTRGAIQINTGIPRGEFVPGSTERLDL